MIQKKSLKYIIPAVFFASLAIIFYLSTTMSVLAIAPGAGPSVVQSTLNIGAQNVTSVSSIMLILVNVIKWIYTAFFVVAVMFILIAAYNFMRGGTNPKAVETAKAQLKYAVIAIVVALIASGVSVVIGMFIASQGQG